MGATKIASGEVISFAAEKDTSTNQTTNPKRPGRFSFGKAMSLPNLMPLSKNKKAINISEPYEVRSLSINYVNLNQLINNYIENLENLSERINNNLSTNTKINETANTDAENILKDSSSDPVEIETAQTVINKFNENFSSFQKKVEIFNRELQIIKYPLLSSSPKPFVINYFQAFQEVVRFLEKNEKLVAYSITP